MKRRREEEKKRRRPPYQWADCRACSILRLWKEELKNTFIRYFIYSIYRYCIYTHIDVYYNILLIIIILSYHYYNI